ncbi:hypothetical protein [Xanthomonas phage BUDD]|nr:hypothetical protein [Xanthomonas phage BUDD]
MQNALDAISQSLGAATPVATMPRPSQEVAKVDEFKEAPEIEDDYQEARSNLKELITQAMEYMPEVVELTKQAQSDKMINALANLLNTAANLNINLSKLSKDIKQAPKQKGNTPGTPQEEVSQASGHTTNIFVGSTEDFLDMMMEKDKRAKEAAKASASVIDGECTTVET